jgi:hypothetical protein
MLRRVLCLDNISRVYNLISPLCVAEQERNYALAPPECPNDSDDQWSPCGASVGEIDPRETYTYVTCRHDNRTACPFDCCGIIRLASAEEVRL